MRLRFAIEVGEECARSDTRDSSRNVDADAGHSRQVEHQAALRDGISGDVVPAATHAQKHPMGGGKAHARLHVTDRQAARDQCRVAVDRGIPDLACLVIVRIPATQDATADLQREGVDHGVGHLLGLLFQRKV